MSRDKTSKKSTVPGRGPEKPRGLAAASAAMREAAREVEAEERSTEAARPKPKKQKVSTREGKKGLVLYVSPEVTVALRKLALDQRSDVQRMGHLALQLLFKSFGKSLPGGGDASARH